MTTPAPSFRTVLAAHWGKLLVLLVCVAALTATPFLLQSKDDHAAATAASYHCPMHPTYTLDRPGDCPICGMRLVPVPGRGAAGPTPAGVPASTVATPQSATPAATPVGDAVYICPMCPEIKHSAPGRCPKCGMDLVKQGSTHTPAHTPAVAHAIYTCPMCPEVKDDEPGRCPKCGMDLVKQDPTQAPTPAAAHAVYTCPMCPEVKDDEPGRCPKCGMNLVKQTAAPAGGRTPDPPEGLAAVHATPEQLTLAGVRTVEARSGAIGGTVRAVGNVVVDESRVRQVTSKIGGWVERLHVSTIGSYVRAGDPLFDLYSPELLASQEEYLRARQAAAEFERSAMPEVRRGGQDLAAAARRRLALFDVPASYLATLDAGGTAGRTVTFRAPFSGHITEKVVLEGQRVEAGMPLLTLTDFSRVWVVAQLFEHEAGLAAVGRQAVLAPQTDRARRVPGRIDLVYPTMDAATRTIRVRFAVANAGMVLKPGMFVDVDVDRPKVRGVVVPDSALIDTGTRQVVFVRADGGQFQPRQVVAGPRADGSVAITSGLTAGETVAMSANFLLDSESRLRALIGG